MSVYLVRRRISDDPEKGTERFRWHVRWERGRGYPIVHLGSWPTETLAKARRKTALEQLARGEVPALIPVEPDGPKIGTTMRKLGDAWLATRIDVEPATAERLRNDLASIYERFGKADPATITQAMVQDWIIEQTARYKPGTIHLHRSTLALVLDYAGLEHNVARDRKVRVPKRGPKAFRLPSPRELDQIEARLETKYRPLLRMLEHTGMRISEALALEHDDIDHRRGRLRVEKAKTHAGRRWIDQIDGLPVLPAPGGRGRVFSGMTRVGMGSAMRKACDEILAADPAALRHKLYSPHDMRHLHLSRLVHAQRLSPAQIAERAGHSSSKITLGTYTHVIPPDEE